MEKIFYDVRLTKEEYDVLKKALTLRLSLLEQRSMDCPQVWENERFDLELALKSFKKNVKEGKYNFDPKVTHGSVYISNINRFVPVCPNSAIELIQLGYHLNGCIQNGYVLYSKDDNYVLTY